MNYRIRERSWIARVAAWKLKSSRVAIVMGKTIHLNKATASEFLSNQRWLRHELKHIEQFRQNGFFKFIFLYVAESIKNGYSNNKYEVEAREAEQDETILARFNLDEESIARRNEGRDV